MEPVGEELPVVGYVSATLMGVCDRVTDICNALSMPGMSGIDVGLFLVSFCLQGVCACTHQYHGTQNKCSHVGYDDELLCFQSMCLSCKGSYFYHIKCGLLAATG